MLFWVASPTIPSSKSYIFRSRFRPLQPGLRTGQSTRNGIRLLICADPSLTLPSPMKYATTGFPIAAFLVPPKIGGRKRRSVLLQMPSKDARGAGSLTSMYSTRRPYFQTGPPVANDQRSRIGNVTYLVKRHKFAMCILRLFLIRNNDGNNGDGQGKAPAGSPAGRVHEQGHVLDYTGILTWTSSHAYIDPDSNVCTNRQ